MTRLPRRTLLCGLSAATATGGLSIAARESTLLGSDSSVDTTDGRIAFDPATDGFGFDNFSTPPVVPEPDDFVSESEIRERLQARWDDTVRRQSGPSLPGSVGDRIRSIVDELSANATRLFGTEGYCYGMAAAAQWYAEEPNVMPADRGSASEITHVDDPLEEPSTPVRDHIEQFHRAQFTDVDSWVQRWPLLRPSRIDYRAQANQLRSAIDEFGSAGVTITGENVFAGHYVLLYGYDETETAVMFAAYDPNDAAEEYDGPGRTRYLGVDTTDGEPLLGSYEESYDRFLFNPKDRKIRARARPDSAR